MVCDISYYFNNGVIKQKKGKNEMVGGIQER